MTDWLSTLKPGDEVGVSANVDYLTKVERLTNTQIITTKGVRYNKVTGRRVGPCSELVAPRLIQPTAELRAGIRKRTLRNALYAIDWNQHGLETLEAIYELAKNGQHAPSAEKG